MKRCDPFVGGMACAAECDCAKNECCKVKRYRKKPVAVEAIQFTEKDYGAAQAFTGGKIIVVCRTEGGARRYVVRTLEGDMTVCEGDYIIRGVKGEFYPCKPDIFEQTYEEVDGGG